MRSLIAGVVMVVAVASMALAQTGAAAMRPSTVTKVYNISDLVEPSHDYPYQSSLLPPSQLKAPAQELFGRGRGGGGGQATFGQPGAAGAASSSGGMRAEDLVRVIMKTIDPQSFVGDRGNSIELFGPGLVVTQTPENHKAIEQLLAQLREEVGAGSRLVTVRFRWIMASKGELDSLLVKPDPKATTAPAETAPAIDLAAVEKRPNGVRYSAQASCYSGQTIHIASGHARTAIMRYEPVVAQQAPAYNAEATQILSGIMVELTPQVAQDGLTAVLNVRSVVSDVPAPTVAAPATQPVPDRLNMLAQQLATTVRMPINKPVLVGGMTLEPDGHGEDLPQMYLVAEVRIGG